MGGSLRGVVFWGSLLVPLFSRRRSVTKSQSLAGIEFRHAKTDLLLFRPRPAGDDSSSTKLSRRSMPTAEDPANFTANSPTPRSSSAALHLALAVICSDLRHAKVYIWQQKQKSHSLLSPRPGSGAAMISTSRRVLRAALPAEEPRWSKEYDSRKDELRLTDNLTVHGVKPARRRSSSSSSSSSTLGLPTCYQSVKARFPNLAFSRNSLHGPPFLLGTGFVRKPTT